jgi:hypothetical protein
MTVLYVWNFYTDCDFSNSEYLKLESQYSFNWLINDLTFMPEQSKSHSQEPVTESHYTDFQR